MALGPAQPPVHWGLGVLSRGRSDLGMELPTHAAWLPNLSMSRAISLLVPGASHGMSPEDLYLYKYWF